MQQAFHALVQFVQQGVTAIFRLVHLLWNWSSTQIMMLMHAPWQQWPVWKQVFLVLVVGGVAWALYKAAREFWQAGEKVLAAFVTLLSAFVRTLPPIALAGLIALSGLWLLNHVDLRSLDFPAFHGHL